MRNANTFYRLTNKYEVYFFYLLLLINLIPVLFTTYFPTVDGPAHLYNSRVIVDLLSNGNSPLSAFYIFNPHLIPNLSGHFILSILLLIFPAFMAEKILLSAYLILLPVLFRWLFNSLAIKNKYLVYFIFPFTYSFLFYWGFYNFHIGLLVFFIGTSVMIKAINSGFTLKRYLLLLILSLIIFYSHIFVLAIFLFTVSVLNLENIIALFKSDGSGKKAVIKVLLHQMILFLPVVILLLYI